MSAATLWGPASPPPTRLGRHRRLSTLAGVHVSPICLGGMSIGDKWGKMGFGAMDKASSFKLLDAFYEAGGNFVDTANNYQDESSEMFIGEWMETRGIRDQIVVATKYTTNYKVAGMIPSKRAHTLEIVPNILYVHWWDYTTTVEEVMNSLHALVMAGKVLYLGISDSPSWVVTKANQYARDHGKTPFAVYQGPWSVLERDVERDILAMVRSEGMAFSPWNVLASGKIRTDAEEQARRKTGEHGRVMQSAAWERTETERVVCKVLEEIGKEVGAKSIQAVAIAYVMQKQPFVFPVIGGRKVEHLLANITALEIALTDEHIKRIEAPVPFEHGFPRSLVGDGTEYMFSWKTDTLCDWWPVPQALRPTPLVE